MLECAKNLIHKKLSIIGLDLGQSTAHFIEIEKTKKSFNLLNLDTIVYANNYFQDGIVVAQANLYTPLQKALKICTSKFIAINIADEFILTEKFNLHDHFNEEEQIAYVMLEAEKCLPYPLDELYYDFAAVKEKQKNSEVTLVACKKTICDSRIVLLQNLGYQTVFLGVTQYLLTDFEKQRKLLLEQLAQKIFLLNSTQSSHLDPKNFYLAMALAIAGHQYVNF